jgi:hypothetical protein
VPSSSLDRLAEASGRLDPGSRALVDLWLVRELDDPAIATMVGTSADNVAARRAAILERLADDAGVPLEEVQPGLRRLIQSPAQPAAKPARPATGDASPKGDGRPSHLRVVEPPAPAAPPPRRRGARVALLLALLAAGVVALVLALTSGGDSGDSTSPARSETLDFRALLRQNGPRATGTLDRSGNLRLDVRGLKRGSYELWLFNSVVDARPVARLRGPRATVAVRLPAERARYVYLDLSAEPDDGNPSHSGASVLRTGI